MSLVEEYFETIEPVTKEQLEQMNEQRKKAGNELLNEDRIGHKRMFYGLRAIKDHAPVVTLEEVWDDEEEKKKEIENEYTFEQEIGEGGRTVPFFITEDYRKLSDDGEQAEVAEARASEARN